MKYLLSREVQPVLARFAWSRMLLAFDFDGTLAPIVAQPERARMRAGTRARLMALAQRYPCAVISGRSLADVKARIAGVPVIAAIGNHGLEPSRQMREHAELVGTWLPHLHRRLGSEPGVEIENKRYSLAVHYRRSRRKRAVRAQIDAAIAELGAGVRAIEGKQVVNVVPLGAPHKGMALEALRDNAGLDTAVYVGDDITDEDVFTLDQPGRLLAIRIGRSSQTGAAYYLRQQAEIDALLDLLIGLRADLRSHRVEEA
jgi:trehalose 6-phosphate phosphatase